MKVNIGDYTEKDEDRVIDVEIHDYDTYSLDHTLAHVIHPALVEYRKAIFGAPFVDNEDVPEEIQHPEGYVVAENGVVGTDDNWDARWIYVVEEMIWTFAQLVTDWEDPYFKNGFDKEGYDQHEDRIRNGLRLFGKYYRCLWT